MITRIQNTRLTRTCTSSRRTEPSSFLKCLLRLAFATAIRCGIAETFSGNMGVATRRVADTEEMVSVGRKFQTASRVRHRQFAGGTVQPDLRDVTVGKMAGAETSVNLTNAFFVPDPQQLRAQP